MNYEINIAMSQDSANKLTDDGFSLYAFKAVSGPKGGTPVVWFQTKVIGLQTNIGWSESFQAYTMVSAQLSASTRVTATNAFPIDLGDVLTVNDPDGTGVVTTTGGDPAAISILNDTSTPFTCGITQMISGTQSPLCAFPLFGNSEDLITPIEKVFLMFATQTVDTGTVLERSFSKGVLIDLTGVPAGPDGAAGRQVNFDINASWDAGGAPWAQVFDPNADLVGLLIEPSAVPA